MPCSSLIGDHTFVLLFIPPVIQCMVSKNIQQLKVTTKNNSWKSPDLLDHDDLFAISTVSDSAHFLIHSSVFLEHCPSLFEPLQQKCHRQGPLNNRNVFLIVLEAGSPRSRHQQIHCLVRDCVLVHNPLLVTSHGESGKRSLWGLFCVLSRVSIIRTLIPNMRALPSTPSNLPKPLLPNTITLVFNMWVLGRHTFSLHLAFTLCHALWLNAGAAIVSEMVFTFKELTVVWENKWTSAGW